MQKVVTAAAAVCAVAVFAFAAAVVSALRIDIPRPEGQSSGAVDMGVHQAPSLDHDALLLAVDNDPFQSDRQRPALRYRLPGDIEPEPEPEPAPPPRPDFRLHGTTLSAAGSGALIQVGDATPRMIAEGDYLLGYRLERVAPTAATLSGAAGVVTLNMPTPPQQVAARPAEARGRDQRAQSARERAQAQQLLRRARESGASPQALQALMRMIEQRGIDAVGNIEFGPNGTMTIHRAAPAPPDTTGRAPDSR